MPRSSRPSSSSSSSRQRRKRKNRQRLLLGLGAIAVIGIFFAVLANGLASRTPPPVSEKVAAAYANQTALAAPSPTKVAPVVMFVGDSYSAGTGATSENTRWTTLLSASKGWTENNVALGGTGYLKTAGKNACGRDICDNYKVIASKLSKTAPDLIIVSGGRNDGATLTSELQAAIDETFAQLRLTYPAAKIVATSPIRGAEAPPSGHAQVVAAVNAAVVKSDGVMLDIGAPFLGHPELITEDQVHPNNAGHKALADTVGAAFDKSGIKLRP